MASTPETGAEVCAGLIVGRRSRQNDWAIEARHMTGSNCLRLNGPIIVRFGADRTVPSLYLPVTALTSGDGVDLFEGDLAGHMTPTLQASVGVPP